MRVPYYFRDPKGDPNSENYPYASFKGIGRVPKTQSLECGSVGFLQRVLGCRVLGLGLRAQGFGFRLVIRFSLGISSG